MEVHHPALINRSLRCKIRGGDDEVIHRGGKAEEGQFYCADSTLLTGVGFPSSKYI